MASMFSVIFELTDEEKKELEAILQEHGGGPLTPVEFNPYVSGNFSPTSPDLNKKVRYSCNLPDGFWLYAKNWRSRVVRFL